MSDECCHHIITEQQRQQKKSKRPLFIWLLSHLQQQILLIFVCKVCLMNKSTFHIDLPITELCWYSITQKCIDVHYLLVCLSVLALQWIGKALCLIWQLVYPPAKLDRRLTELMNDIDLTQLIYIIVLILTYLQDVQCDLDSCLYVHTTRCHEKVQYRSAFFLTTSHTHLTHICEKSKFMIARCYLPGFWRVTILRDTFLLYIFIWGLSPCCLMF